MNFGAHCNNMSSIYFHALEQNYLTKVFHLLQKYLYKLSNKTFSEKCTVNCFGRCGCFSSVHQPTDVAVYDDTNLHNNQTFTINTTKFSTTTFCWLLSPSLFSSPPSPVLFITHSPSSLSLSHEINNKKFNKLLSDFESILGFSLLLH